MATVNKIATKVSKINGAFEAQINNVKSTLRYGKTGDKNVQLVLQHCCKLKLVEKQNVACFTSHESKLSCNN